MSEQNQTENQTANKQTEVGALWKKEGRRGAFFGGTLDFKRRMTKEQWDEFVKTGKLQIVIFDNEFKKDERHPDARIFSSKPRDTATPAPTPAAKKKPAAPADDDGQII